MHVRTLMGAALLLAAAVGTAQEPAADRRQLQGSWTGSLVHVDGKEASAEEKQVRIRLAIAGDNYKAFAGDTVLMEGTFRLDPAARPRTIDAIFADGPFKGAVQKGVYELRDNELVVNFAPPGEPRPVSLQTRPETGESTTRYVREK